MICAQNTERNKKATEILGGNFVWEELFLDSLGRVLNDSLLGNLAIAALLGNLALNDLLLEDLVLEDLGEQEVTTDSSGSHTDHDTDDDEGGVILLLLFLVEAEHGEHPPFLIGKRVLSHILDSIIAENRELRMNISFF